MKKYLFAAAAVLSLGLIGTLSAQEFTSAEDVEYSNFNFDFGLQGEYTQPDAGRAFQIIADGNGQFRVVGYQDGLPGDGWDRSKARFFGKGEIIGNELVITGEKMDIPRYEGVEGKSRVIVFDEDMQKRKLRGRQDGDKYYLNYKGEHELIKVHRESPTLGQKAPEGALVVFDGTNLDQFEEGAKINDKAQTLWSEARTKPFQKDTPYLLHLEFLTSFMPTKQGQARSNSGVYIAEAYECQVLDSFGLEGENNECGGFYQFAQPIVNMCFSPLTWQTYDIDFTPAKYANGQKTENARVTVRHNGVVIHDNVELPKETPGCKAEADEARGLFLQGHGNKVQYRNIWVQYK